MSEVVGDNLVEQTSQFTNVTNGIELKKIEIEGAGTVPDAFVFHYREPAVYGDEAAGYDSRQTVPRTTKYRYPTSGTTSKADPDMGFRDGETMLYLDSDNMTQIEGHPDSPDDFAFPQFRGMGTNREASMGITQGIINDLLEQGILSWDDGEDTDIGAVRFLDLY